MKVLSLLFICNNTGTIEEVLVNNVKGLDLKPGLRFLDIFDRANLDKAQNFFLNCLSPVPSSPTELIINIPGLKPPMMSYQGMQTDTRLLFLGSTDLEEILKAFQEHTVLNNELVNAIRSLWKNQLHNSAETDETSYLEEMSKVNNELISTQRELSKKNIELAQLNEIKNRFVGMAAHDLRNPLSAISSFSDFLLEDLTPESDPTQREFIQIIHDTSSYMLNMVDGLLDLTYMESGQVKLELVDTDFGFLLQDTVRLLQVLAEKRGIELLIEACPEQCILPLDPVRFRQVLSNLIGNAIKYSPENTRIILSATYECTNLVLKIADQGYGISKEEQETIFEPFKRAASSAKTLDQSAGLGLSISKSIVMAHKGTISVESSVGEGATFIVTVPSARQQ